MLTEYLTCITHSFIGVFNDTPDNGLNNWTQSQSEQGFSWRPGSVSFRPTDGIVALVGVKVVNETELEIREHAMRVIQVPLEVGDAPVITADIINFHEVTIPKGKYALIFQHWWIDETEWKLHRSNEQLSIKHIRT